MLTTILIFSILSVLMWGSLTGIFIYVLIADEKRKKEKSLKKGSEEDKK